MLSDAVQSSCPRMITQAIWSKQLSFSPESIIGMFALPYLSKESGGHPVLTRFCEHALTYTEEKVLLNYKKYLGCPRNLSLLIFSKTTGYHTTNITTVFEIT